MDFEAAVDSTMEDQSTQKSKSTHEEEEEELQRLLLPDVRDLPQTPPSAVQSNFVSYFAPGFLLFLFQSPK